MAVEPAPSRYYEKISLASGNALRDIIFDRPTGGDDFSSSFDLSGIPNLDFIDVNGTPIPPTGRSYNNYTPPLNSVDVLGANTDVIGKLLKHSLSDTPASIVKRKDDAGGDVYTVQNVRSIFADGNNGYKAYSGVTFRVSSSAADASVRQLTFESDATTGEALTFTMRANSTHGEVVRSVLNPSEKMRSMFDAYEIEIPRKLVGLATGNDVRVVLRIGRAPVGEAPYSAMERDATAYNVAAHFLAVMRFLRVFVVAASADLFGNRRDISSPAFNSLARDYQMHRNSRDRILVPQLAVPPQTNYANHKNGNLLDAALTFLARIARHGPVYSYDCREWEARFILGTPAYGENFIHSAHTRSWFENSANGQYTRYEECARYAALLRAHPLIDNPSERPTIEETYKAARTRMLVLYAAETQRLLESLMGSTDKIMRPYVRLMRLYTGYLDRAIIAYNAPLEMAAIPDGVNWKQVTAAPLLASYVNLDGSTIDPPSEPQIPYGIYPELILSKSSPPADAKTMPPLYEMLSKAAEEVRLTLTGRDEFDAWIASISADPAKLLADANYVRRAIKSVVDTLNENKTIQLHRFIRYFIRGVVARLIPETASQASVVNAVNNPDSFVTPGRPLGLQLPETFEIPWARERISEALFDTALNAFTQAGITDLSQVTRERLNLVFVGNFAGIAANMYDLYVTASPLVVHQNRLLELANGMYNSYPIANLTADSLRNWAETSVSTALEEVFMITNLAFRYLSSVVRGPTFGLGPAEFAAIETQFVGFASSLHFKEGVQPWFLPAAKKYADLFPQSIGGDGFGQTSTSATTGRRTRRGGDGGSGGGGSGGGGDDDGDDGDDGGDEYMRDREGAGNTGAMSDAALKLELKRIELRSLREKNRAAREIAASEASRATSRAQAEQLRQQNEQAILTLQRDVLQRQLEVRQAKETREDALRVLKEAREDADIARQEERQREADRSRVEELNAKNALTVAQTRLKNLELAAKSDEDLRTQEEHQRKLAVLDRQAAVKRDEELFADAEHRRKMNERRIEMQVAERKRISDEERRVYEESIRQLKEAHDVQRAAIAAQKATADAAKASRDVRIEELRHQNEMEVLQEKRLQISIQHRVALANERSAQHKAENDAALEADRVELRRVEENIAKHKLDMTRLQNESAAREADEKARDKLAQKQLDAAKLRLREQEERSLEAAAERKRVADEAAAAAENEALVNKIALQEAQNRSAKIKAAQAATDAATDKEVLRLKKELADAQKVQAEADERIRVAKARSDEEFVHLRHDMNMKEAGAKERLQRAELRREAEVNELNTAAQRAADTEKRILLESAAVQINSHFFFARVVASERGFIPNDVVHRQAQLSHIIARVPDARQEMNTVTVNNPQLVNENVAAMNEATLRQYIIRGVNNARALMIAIRAYTAQVVTDGVCILPQYTGPIEYSQIDAALNSVLNVAALVGLSSDAEKALKTDPNMISAVQKHAIARSAIALVVRPAVQPPAAQPPAPQ